MSSVPWSFPLPCKGVFVWPSQAQGVDWRITKTWAKCIFILYASSHCKGCQIPSWRKTMNLEGKCNVTIFYPKEPASFPNVWMFSSVFPGPWVFQEVCNALLYSLNLQVSPPPNPFSRVPRVSRYKSRDCQSSGWKEHSMRKLVEGGRQEEGTPFQQRKGLLRPICKTDNSLSVVSTFVPL